MAAIDLSSWKRPLVFNWLQHKGNIEELEMYRTLNCGVGMVLCVPSSCEEIALAELRESGEEAFVLGKIEPLKTGASQVQLIGSSE